MELITNLSTYIQGLTKEKFLRFFTIVIACIGLTAGLLIYGIYRYTSSITRRINTLAKIQTQTNTLLATYNAIQREKRQLAALLEKQPGFEIKSFFEKFCRELGVKPQSDWNTPSRPLEGEGGLEEVTLSASFSDETTESMTSFLTQLAKHQIVYVKELTVRHQKNKKIRFDITIATLKYTTEAEE